MNFNKIHRHHQRVGTINCVFVTWESASFRINKAAKKYGRNAATEHLSRHKCWPKLYANFINLWTGLVQRSLDRRTLFSFFSSALAPCPVLPVEKFECEKFAQEKPVRNNFRNARGKIDELRWTGGGETIWPAPTGDKWRSVEAIGGSIFTNSLISK